MTARPSRVEEEEIPFAQVAPRDTHPDTGLFIGRPWEVDVEELIDLLGQSRAVDPADREASKPVGCAEKPHRRLDKQLRFVGAAPFAEKRRAFLFVPLDLRQGLIRGENG